MRPLNLVIVYVTQVIFYFVFFDATGPFSHLLSLRPPLIYYFAVVTVLITASGYLINDHFDRDTDLVNSKIAKLPKIPNLLYYFSIVFLGFGLALWIAWRLGCIQLSIIYLAAVLLLYLYSARWKQKVLIGNVVVALFTAGVPLVLIIAEREYLTMIDARLANRVIAPLLLFSLFAFLLNLLREIIKDIEDMEGDIVAGSETLPVKYGVKKAKLIAAFFGILLLSLLISFSFVINGDLTNTILILIVVMIMASSYLVYQLLFSKNFNPSMLSKVCKVMMIGGLMGILLYHLAG